MGDVADAVDLHRGLVYPRFTSKDELVAAVVGRELDRYALAWREQFEADPRAGSGGLEETRAEFTARDDQPNHRNRV